MNENDFYKHIEQIVLNVMKNKGLTIGQWHLGTVETIVSPTKLTVFVDASTTSQTVSCNPDITFAIGDHVWVIFINGNSRDKFVLSKRAVV